METKPLIVIVGPTASGKTALGIDLAERIGGEIICADSRTVYKGMDIGTAKPTVGEQARVPHWGLDLVEPGERFSAAKFKCYAIAKIDEIRARGNIPFLVGGTGLYIDGILFDYAFGPDFNAGLRKKLESLSLEELYKYSINNNISLPENNKNKRYVVRAIEQKSINVKRRTRPIDNSIIVGISTDMAELRQRIRQRAEQIFENGVVDEATVLGKMYGWNSEAMTGNIYPLIHAYLNQEMTLNQVIDKVSTLDWRLAKRQLTWLKRNPFIKWQSLRGAESYISQQLASEQ